MWKYVSRRIRDVCDRTYTVLDVRRPWQCGGERLCSDNNLPGDGQQQQQQQSNDEKVPQQEQANASYCLLSVARGHHELSRERKQHYDTGSNSSDKEGFRRKECSSFQPNWVGAITWTSAIICGWYTSQLICLYRRNHKWDGAKCLPYLISSAHKFPREFQSSNFSHCFPFSAPPSPPLEHAPRSQQDHRQQSLVPTFLGFPIPTAKPSRLEEFDFADLSGAHSNVLFEINNDGRQQAGDQHRFGSVVVNEGRGHAAVKQQPEPKAPTVESAMENLMSVIGEIEYQLGVENLEIGDYATAVSHLKLGTSHQHAGAAFNLGICYEQGFGVKKSARVAMECFHLASSLGHAQAMYNLGVYYARGLGGLRRSRSMAKKCFTAAADLGLQEAIAALGPSYNTPSPGGSSVSTPQSMAAPFDFKFTFDDAERYGYDAIKAKEQPEQLELRLVSAMA